MQSLSINLVKGKKPHFLDQFIAWSLTIGRGVIIITELVALGAFIYRFGLDRQLVDLHDKINQEKTIVNFLKKNEDTYRNLQNRLSLANTTIQKENHAIKLYDDISSLFTSDILVKTFVITQDTIRIEATIQSITPLSKLIDNLKAYPGISGVSLDKIETKTSSGIISIGITANLKQ